MTDNPKIFTYVDGDGKKRHGDPTALLRRLHSYCYGDFNQLADECESHQPETAFAANERLAKAVCQTFHLGQPWDEATGVGVLEGHWREVLAAFLDHPEVTTADAVPSPEGAEATPARVEGV